jgi:hypothetical protein
MKIPNLLLIAGTGTKAGKTTMACRIIGQFPDLEITAIKITPHFHETTPGLVLISEKTGFSIYKETDRNTFKDTSRMLKAGAGVVYFAKVTDARLTDVFTEIMKQLPQNAPVICESPALRDYIEPGVFIIMTSDTVNKQKNLNNLQTLPHVMFKLEELESADTLPIKFEGGRWHYME